MPARIEDTIEIGLSDRAEKDGLGENGVRRSVGLEPSGIFRFALGRIASDWLLGWYRQRGLNTTPLEFRHAAFYPTAPGLPWLLTSYHPSRQNTQTGRLTAEMFDQVWSIAREHIQYNVQPSICAFSS